MDQMMLYAELSPEQVSRWAGAVHHSPGWHEGYSLKNEASTDDMVAAVQNGKYRLKVSHMYGRWIGAHWLKDMDYTNGTAWFNGIIFEEARGEGNYWAQLRDWELFERWAAFQGFRTLICAVFASNHRSLKWSRERCKLEEIAYREKASPRQPDGVLSDCIIFAKQYQQTITPEALDWIMGLVDEAMPGTWRRNAEAIEALMAEVAIEKME